MKKLAIPRRTFLRGLAGSATVALALPALEAMFNANGTAHADETPIPRRFGIWFWGNGVRPDRWLPATTGMSWTPSEELAPLSEHRDVVSVVSGTDVKFQGIAHYVGRAAMLVGGYNINDTPYGNVTGASIDQVIATEWEGQTRFRSLEIGVTAAGKWSTLAQGSTSWNDNRRPIPAEFNPRALFDRLFGADFSAPEKVREMRKSVLDVVSEDTAARRKRLGKTDQTRLDAHLQGVRDLERTLTFQTSSCTAPPRPDPWTDNLAHELHEQKNKLMVDILALALACDLTRVFSYEFSSAQSDTIFWEVGATEGDHVMTHDDRGLSVVLAPQTEKVHQAVVFTMQQFAYLIGALKALPEGDGTVLDHACILATTEVNDGTVHTITDMPILLAGRAGGRLRAGQHYRAPAGENVSKVLFTCLRAVGVQRDRFGVNEGEVSEGLSALEA